MSQEFNDNCDALAARLRTQGAEKKAAFVDKKKEEKAGYFNFTMVMMNGQLATGIVEQVWGKLKNGMKRTLLNLVFAMFRVGAKLARRPVVHIHAIKRELATLVREQQKPKGFKTDKATYMLLR